MSSEEVYAAVKASIAESLVQLGRGSGITPDQRENMVTIIAAPLGFIIEEAIYEAAGRHLEKARAALEQIVEVMPEYAREEDGANVALKIASRALTSIDEGDDRG